MEPIKITLVADTSAAADAIKDLTKQIKDHMDSQIPRSVQQATKSLDDLTRKMRSVQGIIEEDKKKLTEMDAQREKATGAAKKQADEEVANIQRIIKGREQEILRLEEKKLKAEEVIAIEKAGSQAEIDFAKAATVARMTQIGAMKDATAAQITSNTSVEAGTDVLTKYVAGWLSMRTVVEIMQRVKQAIDDQRSAMEQSLHLADQLQNMAMGDINSTRPFAQAAGLYDAAGKTKAESIIGNIISGYKIEKGTAVGAASQFTPYAKDFGMDVGGEEFSDIAGNIGVIAQQTGISPQSLSLYAADTLHQNRKATGADINAKVGGWVNQLGGGERAKYVFEAWQQNKATMEQRGITSEQFFTGSAQAMEGVSPEGLGDVMSSFVRALSRDTGKTSKEYMSTALSMIATTPMQEKIANQTVAQFATPGQAIMPMAQALNAPQDLMPIMEWYAQAAKDAESGKTPDYNKQLQLISTLHGKNKELAAQVFRGIGGPRQVRGAAAMGAKLMDVSPSLIPIPSHAAEQGEAMKGAIDLQKNVAYGVNEWETAWGANVSGMSKRLDPMEMGGMQRGLGQQISSAFMAKASDNEFGAGAQYAEWIIALSKKKMTAKTPQERQRIQGMQERMYNLLRSQSSFDDKYSGWGKLEALVYGKGQDIIGSGEGGMQITDYTDAQVLNEMNGDPMKWITHNIPWEQMTGIGAGQAGSVMDKHQGGEINKAVNDLILGPTAPITPTKPTTQPSTQPVSVNYHNRNTYYGYGYDSIGGINNLPNNYG